MKLSIAVVVPVYNGSTHLAGTIRSVLQQVSPPSEIIVVEDGSPVPSAHVVAQYPQVRYVVQQNSGVSQARNHGVSRATADWVCFLDQDDLLMPDHLQQIAQAIEANSAIDVCYTGRRVLSAHTGGSITEDRILPPHAADLASHLLNRCPFPPSGVCIRKGALIGSGGFLPQYDLAEDWECWLRLMAHGCVFHRCDQHTVCYRVHPQSVSHRRPLLVMAANLRVIQQRILPCLPRWKRLIAARSMVSRQQADAAILLRQTGRPGGLALLARSIAGYPFNNLRRYKIAAHMILTACGFMKHKRKEPALRGC